MEYLGEDGGKPVGWGGAGLIAHVFQVLRAQLCGGGLFIPDESRICGPVPEIGRDVEGLGPPASSPRAVERTLVLPCNP